MFCFIGRKTWTWYPDTAFLEGPQFYHLFNLYDILNQKKHSFQTRLWELMRTIAGNAIDFVKSASEILYIAHARVFPELIFLETNLVESCMTKGLQRDF